VTLRQAACQLGVDPKYLKGYATAAGIRLQRISDRLILIERSDLERLRSRLGQSEPPPTN
jgi:hypothetical protein